MSLSPVGYRGVESSRTRPERDNSEWFPVLDDFGKGDRGVPRFHGDSQGDVMAAADFSSIDQRSDNLWMDRAACRGLTHLFFPLTAERPQARERREAMARSVCASCAVRVACRDFARQHHEYGLWGGESEDERHEAGYRLIAPIGIRAATA